MNIPGIAYNADGLVPCIVQDADTLEVLMMAWMSEESLALTLERGETVFWSRSRRELWHKGATSGNVQKLVELRYDCDADTLLALVHPAGPARRRPLLLPRVPPRAASRSERSVQRGPRIPLMLSRCIIGVVRMPIVPHNIAFDYGMV